jgi:hypothetical protein
MAQNGVRQPRVVIKRGAIRQEHPQLAASLFTCEARIGLSEARHHIR